MSRIPNPDRHGCEWVNVACIHTLDGPKISSVSSHICPEVGTSLFNPSGNIQTSYVALGSMETQIHDVEYKMSSSNKTRHFMQVLHLFSRATVYEPVSLGARCAVRHTFARSSQACDRREGGHRRCVRRGVSVYSNTQQYSRALTLH